MISADKKLILSGFVFAFFLLYVHYINVNSVYLGSSQVLAKGDGEGGSDSNSGGSGDELDNKSGNTSTSTQTTVQSNQTDNNDSAQNKEMKIEVRQPSGITVKRKTEDGKTKTEVRDNTTELLFEQENGKTVIKTKDKNGKEQELKDMETENEVVDAEDAAGVKIKPENNGFEIEAKGVRAKTNFPLSLNIQTKELLVTTPAGTRVVAVLPDQAVQNMIKNGVITNLVGQTQATSSATVSTESATTSTATSTTPNSITLNTGTSGELEYEIQGVKTKRIFGVLPVQIPKTVTVSATNGQVLATQQNFLSRILDLISS